MSDFVHKFPYVYLQLITFDIVAFKIFLSGSTSMPPISLFLNKVFVRKSLENKFFRNFAQYTSKFILLDL